MSGYTIKAFDDIVSDIIAYVVANAPQITDFTPGSVIRTFCEGAGLSLEEFYVSVYLGFKRYLNNIPSNVFSFNPNPGNYATTYVVFTGPTATQDTSIPIGTKVSTSTGLNFLTTEVGTILTGETTSGLIAAQAENVGGDYNVISGAINTISSSLIGVTSVTNPNAATGGTPAETQFQYQTRFQAYIEGLAKTNLAGLIYGALSVSAITSASAVENFPPVGNVNVYLYVDNGQLSGVTSDIIDQVQAVIDGDGTATNPGYRSAGVNVVVAAPGIVTVNIAALVTTLNGYDLDKMQSDINTAITNYINGLGVGASVIYNEIVAQIMGVNGVSDVDLTLPSSNTAISGSQVARVGTISVTLQ